MPQFGLNFKLDFQIRAVSKALKFSLTDQGFVLLIFLQTIAFTQFFDSFAETHTSAAESPSSHRLIIDNCRSALALR